MVTLNFDTAILAEADAFQAGDVLVFLTGTATGLGVNVITVGAGSGIELTLGGKTLKFSNALQGPGRVIFADNSTFLFGDTSADDSVAGGAMGDYLLGHGGNDNLEGGAVNDSVLGGQAAGGVGPTDADGAIFLLGATYASVAPGNFI